MEHTLDFKGQLTLVETNHMQLTRSNNSYNSPAKIRPKEKGRAAYSALSNWGSQPSSHSWRKKQPRGKLQLRLDPGQFWLGKNIEGRSQPRKSIMKNPQYGVFLILKLPSIITKVKWRFVWSHSLYKLQPRTFPPNCVVLSVACLVILFINNSNTFLN